MGCDYDVGRAIFALRLTLYAPPATVYTKASCLAGCVWAALDVGVRSHQLAMPLGAARASKSGFAMPSLGSFGLAIRV